MPVRLPRPPALRPGDLVMLVSPSGPAPAERVDLGIEMLTSWGLKVELAPGALDSHWYFSGSDNARLAGLNAAFRDERVRGIICTRGGYGAQRIVDGIDFAAARADPKVFTGFSDITALQMALYARAGVASVHGPMAAWNVSRTGLSSVDSLRECLMSTAPVVIRASEAEETYAVSTPMSGLARTGLAASDVSGSEVSGSGVAGSGANVARRSVASGILLGGNLCLIQASIGTPDMPSLEGAILLLEDVDEPPYKIDRMLTHLIRCGALNGLAGVAVGQFTNCADGWPVTVNDVLLDRLGPLGVPILGGLPIGHGTEQLSVPVGVPATLDVVARTLTVESAVY